MKFFDIVYKINSIQNIINLKPLLIEKIYILKKNKKTNDLLIQCKKNKIKTYYVKKINEKNFFYIKKNYDVVAKIRKKKNLTLKQILQSVNNIKILILDRIQDPYNLASCIRTAEAFSINAIIISKSNTTKISSLVHSLSNGASLLTPIILENNIISVINFLKKEKIKIIGLSAKAKTDLKDNVIKPPLAIIMGSEANGIKNNLKLNCDDVFKIKMNEADKSINLSVATGIILSKIKV